MNRAIDPRTAQPFGPVFVDVTSEGVDEAVARASRAFDRLRDMSTTVIAGALRAGADALDAHRGDLVALADRETALGARRLSGELDRTTGQLRMFADLVVTGAHLEAVIARLTAHGAPARDIRRANRPIGVVVVFGSSNFPFAFGVAGGDTASALAAGCPVVAKAHPAHPGTSQLSAGILEDALVASGLPEGSLVLVHGAGPEVGAALVRHPGVGAVGFTGSTAGGRALFDQAASRSRPIPVYAEMGSLNPVVLAPSALQGDAMLAVARQLAGSITAGWGQFCTKPGLLLVPAPLAEAFTAALTAAIAECSPAYLLTPRIRDAFGHLVRAAAAVDGVTQWVGPCAERGLTAPATVLRVDAATFVARAELREELFGPATIVVEVDDPAEAELVIAAVGGSLTGTVHGDPADEWVARAVDALQPHVGRLVAGGTPTGVAVIPAMQHGGPYPSSTAPSYTSVGSAAVRRFLRPVAFQDFPDQLLPPSLADANPWNIERVIDGPAGVAAG